MDEDYKSRLSFCVEQTRGRGQRIILRTPGTAAACRRHRRRAVTGINRRQAVVGLASTDSPIRYSGTTHPAWEWREVDRVALGDLAFFLRMSTQTKRAASSSSSPRLRLPVAFFFAGART
jgi:hypothetical protein